MPVKSVVGESDSVESQNEQKGSFTVKAGLAKMLKVSTLKVLNASVLSICFKI